MAAAATMADLHQAIYDSLKVPSQLQHLEQEIGKHVPDWPSRFFSAICEGKGLSLAWPKFALWLLEEELGKFDSCKPVADLYRRWIEGKKPSKKEWEKAEAEAAAWVAVAAADAAWVAARAAEAEAWAAASAAAWAAASAAAFWERAADKLISILGEG